MSNISNISCVDCSYIYSSIDDFLEHLFQNHIKYCPHCRDYVAFSFSIYECNSDIDIHIYLNHMDNKEEEEIVCEEEEEEEEIVCEECQLNAIGEMSTGNQLAHTCLQYKF